MRYYLLLIGFCYTFVAHGLEHFSDRLTFSARLHTTGGMMGNGNGVAAMMLNATHDTLFISISAARLSSSITAIHLKQKSDGAILLDFDRNVLGNTVRTYLTGKTLSGILSQLIQEQLFLSIATANHVKGEVQGLLQLETDAGYIARMDGYQAGNGSDQTGLCIIEIGMNHDSMVVNLVGSNTDPMTQLLLVRAREGVQGEILLDLTDLIDGEQNFISGGWKLNAKEWNDIQSALDQRELSIIVCTKNFPKGAMRGQLLSEGFVQLSSTILAANSDLNGLCYAWFSPTLDTLSYEVFMNRKDIFQGASFTRNYAEELKLLSPSQHTISGIWTAYDEVSPLTLDVLSALLKGDIQIQLNSGGRSIQQPLIKLCREGFIAELSSLNEQEQSGGQGTAVASYDRNRKNIHCMFAFDGLQGAFLNAQIYFGKKGESGAIEMATEPFSYHGSYKFLRTDLIFALTKNLKIRKKDHTYLVIQTDMFRDGEIGGLFKWNYRTVLLTEDTSSFAGLNEALIADGSFKVFPNPTTNTIRVGMNTKVAGYASLVISDMNGEEVVKEIHAIERGKNTIELDMGKLHPGIYFIELAINGQSTSNTKVVKQ